jgi:tetratricopeptide (TPR) repeat protein
MAYDALLQGNFRYERRTAEDNRNAVSYYEEAIRLDPRYALAYAKLSFAAGALGGNYGGIASKEREEANARARAAAERALTLDPNLAEAHLATGIISLSLDFDTISAERNSAGRRSSRRRIKRVSQSRSPADQPGPARGSGDARRDGSGARSLAQHCPDHSLHPSRHAGHYDEAEAALRKAIVLQPQSS